MTTTTAIVPYRRPTRYYVPILHTCDPRPGPCPIFAMPLHGWRGHVNALYARFGRPYFIDEDDVRVPWRYTVVHWEQDRNAGLWRKARVLSAFAERVAILRAMRRVCKAWNNTAQESALSIGGSSFVRARARFLAST